MACRATPLAVSAILLASLALPTTVSAGDAAGVFSEQMVLVMDAAPGRFVRPWKPTDDVLPRPREPLKKPIGLRHHAECWLCHGG